MFGNTKKDINFLEAYSLKEKKPNISVKGFVIVLVAEIAILASISGFMYSIKKLTEYKNIELTNSIEPLEELEGKVNEIKYETKHLNAKKEIRNKIVNINDVTYKTLTIFEQVLTSDMSIDNMTIDMKSINFIVKGDKEENFSELMNNMESSGLFSKVEISSIGAKDEDGKRKASINAEIIRK